MDADFSHNPNELIKNINLFKKNADLLISSRYLKNSRIINWPISRKILSFLSNYLSRIFLQIPISDYTNCFRIYSKRAALKIIKNCGKIGEGFIILS
jgi:dolichol-phosphate mannosyltransferase